MIVSQMQRLLRQAPTQAQVWLWLGLSSLVSLLYSVPVLVTAFSHAYVIQDDARQHVYWMRRFLDPTLYPNDLTTDYFESVAPLGYRMLYWLFAQFGLDPVVLSKLLPLLLALGGTFFVFMAAMQVLPSPIAGFAAAVLANQGFWIRDDVVSATPVAFVYVLLPAFLYFLMRRSLYPCILTMALQALFYPQVFLVQAGMLGLMLVQIRGNRLQWADAKERRFCIIGLAVAVLLLLPYALVSSPYGPVISAAEAQQIPAMARGGWSRFFVMQTGVPWHQDFWYDEFWVCSQRSGLLPTEWCAAPHLYPQAWLAVLGLPVLLWQRRWFPLVQRMTPAITSLAHCFVISLGLFFVAHGLLFRLHLPNRYTEHSFRILAALAAGVAIALLVDRFLHWLERLSSADGVGRSLLSYSSIAVLGALLLLHPYGTDSREEPFPHHNYVFGRYPRVYEFLAQQPKDTVTASLSPEVNNLPTFTQRPVLVGGQGYILPYHQGYFAAVSDRLTAVIRAQYSPGIGPLRQVVEEYGVDYWLVDRDFETEGYLETASVFRQYPGVASRAQDSIAAGDLPVLLRRMEGCTVVDADAVVLLDAPCLVEPLDAP
ncbi:MAG: hypothetical protein KME20_18320 [Kaiparowitsia implicata GSE-PSE-MK54-09C]|nr:hypothetical protein [Kaiparowitsia implicata GSE-PSE-MK54-09C]